MTPRPVIVRPLARQDIARATRWYEEQSAGLGTRFIAAVDVALAAAGAGAERYPAVYRDVRRVRVEVFPYGVYYVVRAGVVQVLAVTHGRRHPRRWQTRARGPSA